MKIWLSAVHHLHGVLKSLQIQNTLFVWIDALLNYATALGYGQEDHANLINSGTEQFPHGWKDILRFTQFTGQLLMMLNEIA